jgi:hypothetical protein
MIKKYLAKLRLKLLGPALLESELQKLMLGKILANSIKLVTRIESLKDVEFSVFSQFGDDGIIQWLINNIDIPNNTFIEFGIEDYGESNTRFLMMNDNWSGLVMDGSIENIEKLKSQYYYWRHDLVAKAIFITRDNIAPLISERNFQTDVGLLHIDLDGNDYYIWKAIQAIRPIIVIVEYNSLFGIDRPISVIYDDAFVRSAAHYSTLFWGSSLLSLYKLSEEKGYSFIGCNSAGNNAYFVRNDKINEKINPVSLAEGFVEKKYRESRDSAGRLTYLSKKDELALLRGLRVFNTELNCEELF